MILKKDGGGGGGGRLSCLPLTIGLDHRTSYHAHRRILRLLMIIIT